MKKYLFCFLLLLNLCNISNAWENKFTHPAITKQAVNSSTANIDDYLKIQMGLNNGLLTQLFWNFPSDIEIRMTKNEIIDPAKTKTILDWLKAGSSIEDEDGDEWPKRPRHHFYDPTRNSGLDNKTAHPEWQDYACTWTGFDFTGQASLWWAISGSAEQEPTTNSNKWEDARSAFYDSVTKTTQPERDASLAKTMLNLGCVMHLLEDLGVPAHTRNDFLFAHYRTWADHGNDLENNVETKVEANGGNSLWNGSGAAVFDKLARFFDTDTRDSEHYLGNGVLPPDTWGLSEATNYQFWSLSTISGSYLLKYYFPHPHMAYMAAPIEEGTDVKKIYFNGANYGVSHMARKSYIYYYTETYGIYPELLAEEKQKIDSTVTTDDEKVFDDYENITIPRTIDYATGLANYFFRGRLSATARCVECNVIELTITNQSSNSGIPQTLKVGTFEIYWDDPNGNRTQITDFIIDGGWTSSSTLAYNASKTVTFIKPAGEPVKYIVIYKGNICENPADTDSDDENALAVTAVAPPNNCCASYSCEFCSAVPDQLTVSFTGISLCSCCNPPGWGNMSYKMVPNYDINGQFVLPLISQDLYGGCLWRKIIPNGITGYGVYYNTNCSGQPANIIDYDAVIEAEIRYSYDEDRYELSIRQTPSYGCPGMIFEHFETDPDNKLCPSEGGYDNDFTACGYYGAATGGYASFGF